MGMSPFFFLLELAASLSVLDAMSDFEDWTLKIDSNSEVVPSLEF